MIDEDFRTLLLVLLPADTVVEKGTISDAQPTTRVYFQRATTNVELDLDGTAGIAESVFDVEVASLSDDTAQEMVDQIKQGNATLGVLNGALNSSTTSVTVDDASVLPSSVYTILVDSEQMKVTSKAGNVLTVVRGWNGTAAATHADNAVVQSRGMHGFRGTFGGSFSHGIYVQDHTDDYMPKLLDKDEGYAVASFQATVYHVAG